MVLAFVQVLNKLILFNFSVPLVAILLPLWGCIQYSLTINPVTDIPLGIVNYEMPLHGDCFDGSKNLVQVDEMDCKLRKLSCEVIEAIPDDMFTKVCAILKMFRSQNL